MALIARMFKDEHTATAALAALNHSGVDHDGEIITAPHGPVEAPVVPEAMASDGSSPQAPVATSPAPALDAIVARVRQAGIPASHAGIYAEHIGRGEALLLTSPLFMQGLQASEILKGFHPVPVDLPVLYHQADDTERHAAPLSARFGWPVLLNNPTPLSTRFGWTTVKDSLATPAGRASISKQSGNAAPLSSAIGLRTLSSDPAPLSAVAKMRPLLDQAAPLSDRVKMRTLLSEPAPLSKRIGWRAIAHNPAPLSSLLGLPVLTKRQ